MKGADLVAVSATEGPDATIQVQDMYASFAPTTISDGRASIVGLTAVPDVHNDWKLLSGYRTDEGRLVVEASRALDTGDTQDRVVEAGSRRIVWARGSGSSVGYHGVHRGTGSIRFIQEQETETGVESSGLPAHDGFVDVRMQNYTIPSRRTTYACQTASMPTDKKRHVVAIQPLIPEASRKYVHHAIVHVCASYNDYLRDHEVPQICGGYHEDDNPIGSSPLGDSQSQCSGLMYSWAVGVDDFILPPEAGLPIGPSPSDIRFVVLEIHYDNPASESGKVDTAGFRAYYSDTLRQHDAGGITIGDPLVRQTQLEASTPSVHRQSTCPSACTQDFNGSVTVFSEFPHQHYYGKKIYTELFDSSGNFRRITTRVDFWDNGFQQTISGQTLEPYVINPGDSLQTHCIYDTESQSTPVEFGVSTADEMCMTFLFFYPAQTRGVNGQGQAAPFAFCGSVHESGALLSVCGSVAQVPEESAFLPDVQVTLSLNRSDDPLAFGTANRNTAGYSKQMGVCVAQPPQTSDPCSPSPCKNNATCSSTGMGSATAFTCECDSDAFTGVLCENPVVTGACQAKPCINGVCIDIDATDSFECSCDAGWQVDASSGACTVELTPSDAPVCSDGIRNGNESDIDCGFEAGETCSLCAEGLGCSTSADCSGQQVCSLDRKTCSPALRPAGTYVEVTGLKILGVTPTQFLDTMAAPFKAKLAERTGADEVTILRVASAAPVGTGSRRAQSGAVGPAITVDTSVRMPASADEAAAQASVQGYLQGTAAGNSILDDLRAAVPALASQLSVDASGVQVEAEVLLTEESVQEVGSTPGGADDDGEGGGRDDDDSDVGIGVIVGAAVGGVVVVALIVAAGCMLSQRVPNSKTVVVETSHDKGFGQTNPMK